MVHKNALVSLSFHVLFGIAIYFQRSIGFVWLGFIIIGGLYSIISNSDRKYQAGMWAAYLAGAEVLLRMTKSSLFWEVGKYGIILFLFTGLMYSSRKKTSTFYVFFLLLIPSIALLNFDDLSEVRDLVSFNLSGPLCLAMSATYFYNIKVSPIFLTSLVRHFVFPIISILVYLFLKTPDAADITFKTGSNFAASGGFGPNQVSLILGIGLFLIVLLNFYKLSFTGIRMLDYFLVALLLFRAFLTFSRGGVVGAGLGISVLLIVFLVNNPQKLNFRIVVLILMFAGILFYVWQYTNEVTNSSLTYRYQSVDQKTGRKKDVTTGREMIFLSELNFFRENLALGVGPGMAMKLRQKEFGEEVASHSEYSRMMSEHGLFGVVALLIMIVAPMIHILNMNKMLRPMLVAILMVSLFSMLHAAMRLGAIGFLYGLVFLFLPGFSKSQISSYRIPPRKIVHE